MPRIAHKTLRQEAVLAIQKMILDGELEQGARIVEQDVALTLGVSRGPVREALRQLEQEGLVEYIANRGCIVRQTGSREILENDLLETQLELMALELLGGALPDRVLGQLAEMVTQMSAKGTETTINDIIEEDHQFHLLIIQSVHMERLHRIWGEIGQNSVRLLKRFEENRAPLIHWHRELHVDLLAALQTKEMAVIRPAMMRHCLEVVRFQVEDGDDLGFDLENLLK